VEEYGLIMKNDNHSVSVVIPVKNEVLKIKDCIEGILNQTIHVKEIIVIDSGSTDGTLEILKQYKVVKIINIPSSEFNHGLTRKLGADAAAGEFVLLTVGDARPVNVYWIEELLNGFTDDKVAGVCGQQIVPHEKDKNPVDWFRPMSEPEVVRYEFKDAEQFESLSSSEKKNVCQWDDVTAMYRTEILKYIPFIKTSYCEDAIWAKDAILNGYAIVYNNKARVYHYHTEDEKYSFRQHFTIMYFLFKEFGFLYPLPELKLRRKLSMVKTLLISCGLNIKEIFYWYKYNVKNYRARLKANEYFRECLSSGESILDSEHEKLCSNPPSPLKS
jgi:rhamnosyltransferase